MQHPTVNVNDDVKRHMFPMDKDETEEIQRLKTLIRDTPDVFILNNLIMSVRMFTHYQSETQLALRELERQEQEYNEKLLPSKVVLIPDLVRQHMTGKVRLTSYERTTVVEPLKPTQIYVVYDNVFVQELDEPREYSNPDEELTDQYTLVLKEADLEGYVRLELVNDKSATQPTKNQISATLPESIYEKIDGKSEDVVDGEIYAQGSQGSTDSSNLYEGHGSNESCDSRDLSGISRRLKRLRMESCTSSSSGYTTSSMSSFLNATFKRSTKIPKKCFEKVTFTHDGQIYEDSSIQRALSGKSLQQSIDEARLNLNYNVTYLKSDTFAEHFNRIFKKELGDKMAFEASSVSRSETLNSTISLKKVDIDKKNNCAIVTRHEVTPSLRSPWPSSHRWRSRKRRTWPSSEDRDYIADLQCHLVPDPQYFAPEYSNSYVRLNWCMNFPLAERFLETRLSTAQMTVYALALAVHKNFLRNSIFGLATSHIRHEIFWMVESNPKWNEREMGKWMIELLNKLHWSVQNKTMRDYFVEERNMLASVKQENLMSSQKQLKRIIDNPVMFLYYVLEKIEYESQDYPRLNFPKLLELLTQNEMVLRNPNLVQPVYVASAESNRDYWEDMRAYENYYNHVPKDLKHVQPTQVNDTITEIPVKCQSLTQTRLSLLLNFFAEHFLAMAKSCHDLGAAVQKSIYLRQSRLLALLLADDPSWENEALALIDRGNYQRLFSVPSPPNLAAPPETPTRNSNAPTFVENEDYVPIAHGDR